MPVDNTDLIIVFGTLVLLGVPLLVAYRMMRFRKILRECIAEKFNDGKRSPSPWPYRVAKRQNNFQKGQLTQNDM